MIKDVDWDEIEHVRRICNSQADALADTISAITTFELQEAIPHDKTLHVFIEKYETEYRHTLEEAEYVLHDISDFLGNYVESFFGSICIDPMPPGMIKECEESNKDLMKLEIDITE